MREELREHDYLPVLFDFTSRSARIYRYAMFIDLKKRHHWVLESYFYNSQEHLIADLGARVVGPAEAKVRELRGNEAAPRPFP